MTGFVYAIGDGEGLVKIGYSADPCRRLNKISSDCPTAVKLLGVIPATKAHEAEAHALLAPWRVRREWYRCEGPVAAFVGMLPSLQPRVVTRSNRGADPNSLKGWIAANTSQAAFARKMGCSEPYLSQLISGKRGASLDFAIRASRETGGAVPIEAFGKQTEAAQ